MDTQSLPNIHTFLQTLGAYSDKVIKPLKDFGVEVTYKRALSFGLFAPLAQEILEHAKVTQGVILHPFFFKDTHNIYRYEIGTESGVSALLGLECESLAEFVAELDIGYIVNESSLCDEEVAHIQDFVRSGGALILGRDLYLHTQSVFIAQILGSVAKERNIEIFMQDLTHPYETSTSIDIQDSLDSAILEELPENNGAFAYICLESEMPEAFGAKQNAMQELLAPESFKAILKIKTQGVYPIGLMGVMDTESTENKECQVSFCPAIRGTIGCLPKAQVLQYPFVRILAP